MSHLRLIVVFVLVATALSAPTWSQQLKQLTAAKATFSRALLVGYRRPWFDRVFFVAQVCVLRCTPVIVAFDLWLRFKLRVTQSHNLPLRFAFLVVRDFASMTFDHELKQFFVVRNFCGFKDTLLIRTLY